MLKASSGYYYDDRGYKQEIYTSTVTRNGEVVYRSLHPKSIGFIPSGYIIVEFAIAVNSELIDIYENRYNLRFEMHPLENKKICKFRVQNKNVSIETANEIMENEAVRSSYPDWIMVVR